MTVLEYNNIIDKLTVQLKAFQEGFGILSGANTLKDLVTNFCHILRGSFFISDVNIFFKNKESVKWDIVIVHNDNCLEYLPLLKTSSSVIIEYFSDKEFSIITTIPLTDGSFWGMIIGNKIDKTEITEFDKITFQMFLQLLDNAYQSFINQIKEKQLNFSLNHKVTQLNILIDTGIKISKLHEISSMLELSLERAAALTNASRGVLQIISGDTITSEIGFPGDSNIKKVIDSAKRIDTFIEFEDKKYIFILSEKESRQGTVDFNQTDKILLSTIARQVLAAIENEHLHKAAIEKERMRQEIEMAAIIQRRIIPQKLPVIDGFDLAGINIPSLEISGDYYDVIKLKGGRYLIIIADVAGKGVASGLLVNTLNASLNAYIENDFILTDIAGRLNKIIYKSATPDKYITAFIAILDPSTGSIEYINAGHNHIFYSCCGNLTKLDKGGFAFGMFDITDKTLKIDDYMSKHSTAINRLDFGLPYESAFIKLEPGEKILFYTDGITEAINMNNKAYSEEKLELFFLNDHSGRADIFINKLISDVKKHTADSPQNDDITALYLIRNY
jgi:sigma-B regulation protein RsbU (phosphoserine phosphatase)